MERRGLAFAEMNALTCKSCGSAMNSLDLDRRLGIISCRHCAAIYDLTRTDRGLVEGGDGAPPSIKGKLERAPAALPERFSVEQGHGDLLRIRWRWFKPVALFLFFFCLAWDSFLILWYSMGVTMTTGVQFLFFVFPLGHVAVGVGLTYYTAALFLNRTTVTVRRRELRVSHTPLPWWGPPPIPVGDLEQIYVERKVSHNKKGTTVLFQVMAVTRNHTGRKLVTGLTELGQALYLEQEIERVLGIRDRPVAGEHREGETQR